jgi:voltage-gated potassium channel Kch
MSSPDIFAVINAFFTLLSRYAGTIVTLPFIKEIVGAGNSEFIRAAAGAFTGSSSAWIIFLYFREKFYLLSLRFRRDHTIVCGLNYRSLLIVRDLARRKQKPVVIEKDVHNTYIESCKLMGVIVIVGEPADSHLLMSAGATRARYILSFTDSDETNAEVALQTMQLLPLNTTRKETAIIQILNPKLYLMIRKQAFTTAGRSGFRIEFFNQYAIGSKILMDRHPPLCRVDKGTIPFPVIIIGAGKLGENIITRIARMWFEKKLPPDDRPLIYLVDVQSEKILENLNRRFGRMQEACNLIPVSLDVQSAAFQNGILLEKSPLKEGFTAYICFHDDTLGLYTALTLNQYAEERMIKIIVRIEHKPHVARLISDEQKTLEGIKEILPVDMNSLTADSTMILAGEPEYIARAVHENYCKNEWEKGQSHKTNRLLVSWDDLGTLTLKKDGIDGKYYQESNRNQAYLIRKKLNMIGCDIGPLTDWDAPDTFKFTSEEVETLAAVEHERWIQEKLAQGWRYGHVRDDGKKIHPSIIPYLQLSESEKEKDRDTVRIIPRILSLIDFQVYRRSAP